MTRFHRAGLVTGLLFIGATGCGILALLGRHSLGPDLLASITKAEPKLLFSGIMVLVMGWLGAGIGISLYSLLREISPTLALGAAGFRIMEGIFHCLSAVCLFLLVAAARFFAAFPMDSQVFLAVVTLLDAARSLLVSGPGVLSWCIAAFIYYSLFFKANLIPRWLSVWGLVGITIAAIAHVLFLLRVLDDTMPFFIALDLPIAAQELVMAFWLIVKGFNPEAIHATAKNGCYQIRVAGHLGAEWSSWLGGASVIREADGSTLLIYSEVDQSSLFGVLRQLRDAGLSLLSLKRTD